MKGLLVGFKESYKFGKRGTSYGDRLNLRQVGKTHKYLSVAILTLLTMFTQDIFAQKSPVKFLNNTCTINRDTTYGNKVGYYTMDLRYKFTNIGESVIFIDTMGYPALPTESKDTNTLVLEFGVFFENKVKLEKNESAFTYIPFYYRGKKYYEKLICNYTFGKSKLIEFDKSLLVNDAVSQFFIVDDKDTTIKQIIMSYYGSSGIYSFIDGNNNTIFQKTQSIEFTVYCPVKNITDAPIWCHKELVVWSDYGLPVYWQKKDFVMIPPHQTYKMPVQINMSARYKFRRTTGFLVFSEDVFEEHEITVKSDFEPDKRYIWETDLEDKQMRKR